MRNFYKGNLSQLNGTEGPSPRPKGREGVGFLTDKKEKEIYAN